MLPQPFTGRGSFAFTVEAAVELLLYRLYLNIPVPPEPITGKTPRKELRNEAIKELYASGVSVPDIARDFGISNNRVYQIIRGLNR